jgi:hypothetical protein
MSLERTQSTLPLYYPARPERHIDDPNADCLEGEILISGPPAKEESIPGPAASSLDRDVYSESMQSTPDVTIALGGPLTEIADELDCPLAMIDFKLASAEEETAMLLPDCEGLHSVSRSLETSLFSHTYPCP